MSLISGPAEKKVSKIASLVTPADIDDSVPSLQRELELLYEQISKDEKKKEDWRDDSRIPSYTRFSVPYHLKCRDRYHKSKKTYEQQFQYEISQIMNNLNTAYEAARFNRHLCITTLWPPMHNRSELIHTQRYYFRLKPAQRRRLNQILNTNFH
ncbi:uncharacterized protein LOC118741885 [Rhagoletis pomonella]|uniref:uncharacterized protein LOC118741885 n=1 Tax=Rhagoletis pomonella TaxID=28610 RepID=UPI0017844CC4|nr:uncharacterized protein LOC118741885 [Rhagoletis pomonella]